MKKKPKRERDSMKSEADKLLRDYSGFLTDEQILAAIYLEKIVIVPFDWKDTKLSDTRTWPKDLRPAAFTFHLAEYFARIDSDITQLEAREPINEGKLEYKKIPDEGYVIPPGEAIHARTLEKIGLDKDIMGYIDGIKLLAEKFITVHTTSQIWNPGDGKEKPYPMLLEMKNDGKVPVRLRAGDQVCKVAFYKFSRLPRRLYAAVELKAKP